MVLLSLGEAETGAALEVQRLVLLLAALALITPMQFRTFLADDVLLAALLVMLARDSYGRRAPLWLAVPMLAWWANLHGGSSSAWPRWPVHAIRGAQNLAQGRDTPRGAARRAYFVGDTRNLANPYGLRDWIVIVNVLRNPFTLSHISEFRPLFVVIADFYRHSRPIFTFASAAAIMIALLVSFALTPRADDLALFAIAAMMNVRALDVAYKLVEYRGEPRLKTSSKSTLPGPQAGLPRAQCRRGFLRRPDRTVRGNSGRPGARVSPDAPIGSSRCSNASSSTAIESACGPR